MREEKTGRGLVGTQFLSFFKLSTQFNRKLKRKIMERAIVERKSRLW